MEIEKEVNVSLPPADGSTAVVRKAWETPRFDRQEVRSITEAKAFSLTESTLVAGPMS